MNNNLITTKFEELMSSPKISEYKLNKELLYTFYIYCYKEYNKLYKEIDLIKHGFQINTKHLKLNLLGRNYKNYIQFFLETGFLKCTHENFESGSVCRKYLITPEFKSNDIKNFNQVTINTKNSNNMKETIPVKLRKFTSNLEKFDLDINKVNSYINENKETLRKILYYETVENYILDDEITEIPKFETDNQLELRMNDILHKCDAIQNKNFYAKRDDYGRLHTNFTNLNKFCRDFLTVNNKKVVEVDIANSQPFMFSLELNTTEQDVLLYKELTAKGNFYQYLSDKTFFEVANIKKMIMYLFYDKAENKVNILNDNFINVNRNRNTVDEHNFYIAFKNIFPTVWNEIISRTSNKRNKPFSQGLQKIESSAVVDDVSNELFQKKIIFATIHDSILCTEEDAEIVKEVIESAFQNKYGIFPKV